MTSIDYNQPFKKDVRPFGVPNILTLGAGPCTVSPRVLQALATQTLQPLNGLHDKMMTEVREMCKYVFQTKNQLTFALQSSGNGGNECMITNLTDPGDTVIVGISGFWGKRIAQICGHHGLNVIELVKPNDVFTLEEIEDALKKHEPTALFLTHSETITAVLQPLEGVGDLCHKYNCLLGVDAVVTVAATPLYVDRWKIDAAVGGSQKAIGCVPGMALLTFSPLAKERIWAKKSPPPFYFDVKHIAIAWNCFDQQKGFHVTYSSNMLAALHEALAEICEEGLENRFRRHRECAELLWPSMEKLGIKLCIEKPENRFPSVTAFVLPADVDRLVLIERFLDKYQLEISVAGPPNSLRVGFLGYNAQLHAVRYFLEVLEESIHYIRTNQITEHDAFSKFVMLGILNPKKK